MIRILRFCCCGIVTGKQKRLRRESYLTDRLGYNHTLDIDTKKQVLDIFEQLNNNNQEMFLDLLETDNGIQKIVEFTEKRVS